jgi:hypothetical protein
LQLWTDCLGGCLPTYISATLPLFKFAVSPSPLFTLVLVVVLVLERLLPLMWSRKCGRCY